MMINMTHVTISWALVKGKKNELKKTSTDLGTIYSTLWSTDVSEGHLKGLAVL